MKDFLNDKGTLVTLNIENGRDIRNFSIFPDESEILLLPNTQFQVKDILSEEMKTITGSPPNIDCITLTQKNVEVTSCSTPRESMFSEDKNDWYYLVINRYFWDPNVIVEKSKDISDIKKKFKSLPANYSAAIIVVRANMPVEIKSFYGMPFYRSGMITVVKNSL